MFLRVTPPPSKAASKLRTYSGMLDRRATTPDSDMFMLPGATMGAKVTCSTLWNFPSHPRRSSQATLSNVGVRSFMAWRESPLASGNPSCQERPGLWQLAQDRLPDAEKIGSKNKERPSIALTAE